MCVCVHCTTHCGLTVCHVAWCWLVGGRLGGSEGRQALILRVEGLSIGSSSVLLITIHINVPLALPVVRDRRPVRGGRGAKTIEVRYASHNCTLTTLSLKHCKILRVCVYVCVHMCGRKVVLMQVHSN